jgi:hypothetical protein
MNKPQSKAHKKSGVQKPAMKKALAGAAAATMVSLSSMSVINAVAATATMPIIARVIRAIELTVNTSLDFGTLAVTAENAGAATLNPQTGQLTVLGEGGINPAGGAPRAGRIQLKGAPMPVQVSLETNNVQITNGTTFLTINGFNFDTAQGGPQVTVTPTGPGESAILTLGATINTRPRQLTGTYVGSNTIFANYQ